MLRSQPDVEIQLIDEQGGPIQVAYILHVSLFAAIFASRRNGSVRQKYVIISYI